MVVRNRKWSVRIIDRLLALEIGDPQRLESVKSTINESKIITEDDDKYIYEKINDLRKIEPVPEQKPVGTNISAGKIVAISVWL